MIYITCKRIPGGECAVGLYQRALSAWGNGNADYLDTIKARCDESARESLFALVILADLLRSQSLMPQCFKLARNEMGRPYFEGQAWQFSISHSGGYAAVALSQSGAVGIDIETKKMPDDKAKKLAKRYFSEHDCALIETQPEVFLKLWSSYEARAKFAGIPLADLISEARSNSEKYRQITENSRLESVTQNGISAVVCLPKAAPEIAVLDI